MRKMICTSCGETRKPKDAVKGSTLIELVLWLCLLLPGLVYSLWRHSTRHQVCRSCGSTDLVPAKSPRGKKVAAELSA